MKKTLLGLVLGLLVSSLSHATLPTISLSEDLLHIEGGGNPVPWPWMMTVPFPYYMIQGVWLAEEGTHESLYVLQVAGSGNVGQLTVVELDPKTCVAVATGHGIEVSGVVAVTMVSSAERPLYRMNLRAFNAHDVSPEVREMPAPRGVYLGATLMSPQDVGRPLNILLKPVAPQLPVNCSAVKLF